MKIACPAVNPVDGERCATCGYTRNGGGLLHSDVDIGGPNAHLFVPQQPAPAPASPSAAEMGLKCGACERDAHADCSGWCHCPDGPCDRPKPADSPKTTPGEAAHVRDTLLAAVPLLDADATLDERILMMEGPEPLPHDATPFAWALEYAREVRQLRAALKVREAEVSVLEIELGREREALKAKEALLEKQEEEISELKAALDLAVSRN